MADLSMCEGLNCPLKLACYRHTARQNDHWQAWFTIVPYDHDTRDCEMFWDNVTYHQGEPKNE